MTIKSSCNNSVQERFNYQPMSLKTSSKNVIQFVSRYKKKKRDDPKIIRNKRSKLHLDSQKFRTHFFCYVATLEWQTSLLKLIFLLIIQYRLK